MCTSVRMRYLCVSLDFGASSHLSSMVPALIVARWFVTMASVADGEADDLTATKVHCLIALADEHHLVAHGRRLVPDDIERASAGCAVTSLDPLPDDVFLPLVPGDVSPEVGALLSRVWTRYGRLSAGELVRTVQRLADPAG